MEKEWYVVNTYSGHENKVKEKLEMRASSMGMEDYILRVVVPEQIETEIKDGKVKEKVKKMFPGYILVEMVMTDEAWFIVRNTPGVTGFIGSSGKGAKPFPLTPMEVDKILGSMGISRLDIANELNEMVSICSCGDKARFNARKINGKFVTKGEQVYIGEDESYEPLCGKCYLEKVLKM